ncbi:calcium/proton exchanger [uncultured Nitrospira sp.]|uniref:calcium/proton exchanger n=1 Tax=uncultured Nitrospira sp. TaxID=157176 RepID=UPI00313FE8A2
MGLNLLLVFIPIAVGLDWYEANPILVFIASGLAIVPLAGLMGRSTESLSVYIGATLGGLLAATMGNAPELIISIFALKAGLYDVVKASITGSIVGNLLLGMGLAILLGGLRHKEQKFNATAAGMSSGLLTLAGVGLMVPALFHFTSKQEEELSTEIAVVLFIAYLLSLLFTLKTHQHLFRTEAAEPAEGSGQEKSEEEGAWSKNKAIGMLAAVTVGIAFMSEILTGAIEPAAAGIGLTPIFAGVIFLAVFGNAAELMNSVRFARNNQMDLVMGIAVGASTQVVMFVAPMLVFVSYILGPKPLDLLFVPFEIAAIVIAILVNGNLTKDGESHWMEGVMLLGVYVILGIGFFYLPM